MVAGFVGLSLAMLLAQEHQGDSLVFILEKIDMFKKSISHFVLDHGSGDFCTSSILVTME